MAWLRLRVTVPEPQADSVEARLRDAGALAVSLFPAEAATTAIVEPPPGAETLWDAVRVEGLCPPDCDLGALEGLPVEADFVAECDWAETYRQSLRPLRFGRLRIVPKDYRDAPCDTDAVVRMDPGLAFGTGTHPSTALCLDWLAATRLNGCSVLDVGCGSGILAIAAARLGAASVVAVDHDPQARSAAADNARHNAVDLTVLDSLDEVRGRYDVAVANIVANTLKDMAAALTCRARTVVLSGILSSQVDDVAAAYRRLRFDPPVLRDGWAMLVGEPRHG